MKVISIYKHFYSTRLPISHRTRKQKNTSSQVFLFHPCWPVATSLLDWKPPRKNKQLTSTNGMLTAGKNLNTFPAGNENNNFYYIQRTNSCVGPAYCFGGVGLHTSHTRPPTSDFLISFLRRRRGSAQGIGPLASRGSQRCGGGKGQTFSFLDQLLGLGGVWVISQRGRHLQSKGSPDTMNCWKRRAFYFLHCYCDSVKLSLGFPEISPNFNFSI